MESLDIVQKIQRAMYLYSDRTAMVIKDKAYTYKDLSAIVSGISDIIQHRPEGRIGIIAENTIEVYAAILAALICGKTYVILHPSYPAERNKKIVMQAELKVILGRNTGALKGYDISSYVFIPLRDVRLNLSGMYHCHSWEEDYAYIIFTSGSTNDPKGVPITRKNLNAFFQAYQALQWNLNEKDRMLQMFELTFDVSIVSLLYPLSIGASVYTVDNDDMKHFKVIEIMEKYALTFAAVTPSLLQLVSHFLAEIYLPALKYLIVTAEACPVEIIRKFKFCIPNAQIVNLYGPTEGTIYCSQYQVPMKDLCKQYNGMLAIGKPFEGIDILITDANSRILPRETKGELWIAGNQIMRGYLKGKENTTEVFVRRFANKTYYKTGDLCILDKDGDLLYCGRKNQQVKIQGYRIELSEIEYVARRFFRNTRGIVVVPVNQKGLGDELCLLIEGDKCDEKKLLYYLERKLPEYMLPKILLFVDKFPLNNSNKIDRVKIVELIKNVVCDE